MDRVRIAALAYATRMGTASGSEGGTWPVHEVLAVARLFEDWLLATEGEERDQVYNEAQVMHEVPEAEAP